MHLSREYLYRTKSAVQPSPRSAHKSMVNLLWSKQQERDSGSLEPSFRPPRFHVKSSPSAEFLARDVGYRPRYKHSLDTFESVIHIPQTNRNLYTVTDSPNSHHWKLRQPMFTSYGEQEHFSDGENGYDRDRYAAELRRVQYGGGPTAELLLGNNGHSQAPSRMNDLEEPHPPNRRLFRTRQTPADSLASTEVEGNSFVTNGSSLNCSGDDHHRHRTRCSTFTATTSNAPVHNFCDE